MKGEKLVTFLLTIAVIAMIILVGIQNTVGFGKKNIQPAKKMPTVSANKANVEILVAKPTTFIKTISINGELAIKDSSRVVSAETTGKVTEVLVKRGDIIQAGDVIAKADPSTPGSVFKIKDIVSSVSGTVLSVDTYKGQSLSANTTLITVGNPKVLILKMDVPEKYLSSFGLGSEATFTTVAWPDKVYHAVVNFIDNSVNTSTRTVKVELRITDADSKLMAGMFVKTKLIVEKQKNVITVPSESVSTYLSDAVLYVVDSSDKAVRTIVKTGNYNDSETIITSGISVGDRIVVQGSVTDGTMVNIVN